MASPAPVDVGDALDELVNQFADPMSFFRELIQNSLDAGSDEVEIDFEFESSAADPDQGAMVVIVTDFGSGMDREIIDKQLTRLFSSSKDGDMTKIGKFGIGFVSVFAILPDAVCVDTGRAGERWRVLFGADRSFKRLRIDEPIEGTTVRLIKTIARPDYEAFVTRAREVVGYWCRHARGEIRFKGEVISEPFGLDAPLVVSYRDEYSEIHLGHRGGATLHGFYNGGLTLIEGDQQHPSSIAEFHGIAFKVSSRYLEHTLSRDDVIKEEHYGKVVTRLRELVVGKLRAEVFGRLDRAVRAPPRGVPSEMAPPRGVPSETAPPRGVPSEMAPPRGVPSEMAPPRGVPSETAPVGSPEGSEDQLAFLYQAASWHLAHAQGALERDHRKLAAARGIGGRVWTWGELQKAAASSELWFDSVPTPLALALEARGVPVLRPLGEALGASPNRELVTAIDRATGIAHVPRRANEGYVLPLLPAGSEPQRWAGLGQALDELLDDAGYQVAAVQFARFAESGSELEGRLGVSQREFGEVTSLADANLLGKRLLDRKRVLVVDADHPSVGSALVLASQEPELAAYQLAKTFLLLRGAIDPQADTKLCQAAMRQREKRCRRQPS